MEIRRLGPADEALLLGAAPLLDRPPLAEAARAFLADPLSYFLLASVEGQPAGFIRAHELRQFDSPRPQFFLYEIGVDPEFQRRGIARALIAELHALARARDAEEDFVLTNPGNEPAMALYRATGGVRDEEDVVMFVYPLV
ncbi:MAG: Ribosomal-protein-S18p-alanine acetyltransferase [uncultured Thermomicrobiales bacterium]|uniref:Ribosomal-protein-S18p-alanine acetyltransferase n=1 Tax=uncultured Thermomicrobiales bacterium TaxID=1645740 RepID=A0A6J4UTJ4_9BACT|nr:MAG: Ribosomal-protein-S18p-alanine acetyltransferase [uncultured Thermomicrobiales bacterium]